MTRCVVSIILDSNYKDKKIYLFKFKSDIKILTCIYPRTCDDESIY